MAPLIILRNVKSIRSLSKLTNITARPTLYLKTQRQSTVELSDILAPTSLSPLSWMSPYLSLHPTPRFHSRRSCLLHLLRRLTLVLILYQHLGLHSSKRFPLPLERWSPLLFFHRPSRLLSSKSWAVLPLRQWTPFLFFHQHHEPNSSKSYVTEKPPIATFLMSIMARLLFHYIQKGHKI